MSSFKLSRFLGCLLLGISSVAVSQTISLDNVPPISLSNSATVDAASLDAATGNLIVRSASGSLSQCLPQGAWTGAAEAGKAVFAGNTGLAINNSGRIELVTAVPVGYLNRSVANGRRVVRLRVAQPLLCADFAVAPGGAVNPVALEIRDPNNESSGLLFGGITSSEYFTNGASPSLYKVNSDAQLACCIMQPASNATCFQGATVGTANQKSQAAPELDARKATTGVSADLAVGVSGPSSVAPGGTFAYTISVANVGAANVTGVRVRDWFPKTSGGFPAPLGAGAWTCAASAGASCGVANGTGNITFNAVALNSGASITISVIRPMSASATANTVFSVSAAAFAPPGANESLLTNNQGALTATVLSNSPPVINAVQLPSGPLQEDQVIAGIQINASDSDSVITPANFACSAGGSLLNTASCAFSGTEPNFLLTISPQVDANGSGSFTIGLTDGFTPVSQLIPVTVLALNDAPEFTLGANLSYPSNSTGINFANDFVTAIRRGPVTAVDEAGQSFIERTVTVDSGGFIFSTLPDVSYSGSPETGTLALGLNGTSGTAVVRVRMQDSGGALNGGLDSTEKTFTITVQSP